MPATMISGMVTNPLTMPQSKRCPSMRPKTTRSKPALASATPTRSRRWLFPMRRSGTKAKAAATSATPMGMLT